ncbi:MAG: S1C family serine protease [Sciscionella sp.]
MGDEQSESRSRAGLVFGFVLLALIAGGAAGAFGGYLAARQQGAQAQAPARLSSVPDALNAAPPQRQTKPPPSGSVAAVAAQLLPEVVELRYQVVGGELSGSGVVISSDGAILTNNHVVAKAANGAADVQAVFHDGRVAPVRIIGRDPTSDLAVVKAEGVSGLRSAEFGRSDDLRVGQQVVAVGSPYELAGTVTAGVVSALHRAIRAGGANGDQATVMDAIQTDAPINHGNSGGPLVNMAGQVVGINSAIYSPSAVSGDSGSVGIGFAIPVDQAKRIGKELAATGKAVQTTLGVGVAGSERGAGALIVSVTPGGPASKGGLTAGQVVVAADGRLIGSSDALVAAVHAAAPGHRMTLALDGGKTLHVTLGGRPVGGP